MKRIFLLTLLILSLCGCESSAQTTTQNVTDGGLAVHFIDVGQGDCELIESNGEFMLVDCGEKENSSNVINYIQSCGANDLKYVIATHPHSDHIGGMSSIIDTFDIGTIIMPDKTSTSSVFEKMLTSIDNKNLEITIPAVGDTYTLGDASFTIVAPVEDYDDLNNVSVGIRLVYGDTSFLMCGDAEKDAEKDIAQQNIKCDVLKVGHHGSSTSSSDVFLDKAAPTYAVISCGKDNSYGHPHTETIEKLEKRGITYMRTDELGTIKAVSNGKNISWYYGENQTTPAISQTSAEGVTEITSVIETAMAAAEKMQTVSQSTETYILNTNSKKFHKPDCGSASKMSEKNKQEYTGTREELIDMGYTPCQSCNP